MATTDLTEADILRLIRNELVPERFDRITADQDLRRDVDDLRTRVTSLEGRVRTLEGYIVELVDVLQPVLQPLLAARRTRGGTLRLPRLHLPRIRLSPRAKRRTQR